MSACPQTSHTNPVKAIRLKCLDCSGDSAAEVKQCVIPDCPLFPFRFGKNPYRTKREMSEEQKNSLRTQLDAIRPTRTGIPAG